MENKEDNFNKSTLKKENLVSFFLLSLPFIFSFFAWILMKFEIFYNTNYELHLKISTILLYTFSSIFMGGLQYVSFLSLIFFILKKDKFWFFKNIFLIPIYFSIFYFFVTIPFIRDLNVTLSFSGFALVYSFFYATLSYFFIQNFLKGRDALNKIMIQSLTKFHLGIIFTSTLLPIIVPIIIHLIVEDPIIAYTFQVFYGVRVINYLIFISGLLFILRGKLVYVWKYFYLAPFLLSLFIFICFCVISLMTDKISYSRVIEITFITFIHSLIYLVFSMIIYFISIFIKKLTTINHKL